MDEFEAKKAEKLAEASTTRMFCNVRLVDMLQDIRQAICSTYHAVETTGEKDLTTLSEYQTIKMRNTENACFIHQYPSTCA